MQGQWNHDRAYYRCRFRADYAVGDDTHPKSVYVKEDAVIPGLDACLRTLFDDDHIDDTRAALAGTPEADHEAVAREAQLRAGIAECDRKQAKYRALLDHEDAVDVAAKWIAETQRDRKALERQLGQQIPGGKLTTEQVKALATALRDIVEVLAEADLDDKARLYSELGISLTLDPTAGVVHVRAQPRGVQVRVGGGTLPGLLWVPTHNNPRFPAPRGTWEATGRRQTVTSTPLVIGRVPRATDAIRVGAAAITVAMLRVAVARAVHAPAAAGTWRALPYSRGWRSQMRRDAFGRDHSAPSQGPSKCTASAGSNSGLLSADMARD